MNRFVTIISICLIFAGFIVACIPSGKRVEVKDTSTTTTKTTPSVIEFWTDEETGVQYVIYRDKAGYAGFGGITPRLNSDGTLYITKEK